MVDHLIDACRWHVAAEEPRYQGRALDHFRDRYQVLLEFLHGESLLRDPTFGQEVKDWTSFEIHVSNLTEEGHALFRECHGKWRPAFGQGQTQRHLVQWKRRLAELRG